MSGTLDRTPDKPHLKGVQIRWDFDFWDRELNGIADWQGRDYWFEIADRRWLESDEEPVPPEPRYWLIPLTDDELRQEWKMHRLFERHVGTHSCYRGNRRLRVPTKPRTEWETFYGRYPPAENRSRSYSKREPIGWFESSPAWNSTG